MTKHEQERLRAIKERVGKARDRQAKARQAVAAAEKLNDAEAVGIAQAELDAADADVEHATALENLMLTRAASGNSVERFGGTLVNNLDAQQALADIASSSAPLRSTVAIGQYMGVEEVAELTGRALRAAPVDVPDRGGAAGFVGPIAPPAPPTTLLDFFQSVAFSTRTADLLRRSGVASAAIAPHGTAKTEAG